MHLTKRYRQLTAILLLVVYAFIATPVQLWHHHDAEKPITDAGIKTSFVSKIADTVSEANCLICHHQYSVYNDDIIVPVIAAVTEFSFQNGHYTPVLVHFIALPSQNKGPPVFSNIQLFLNC
ncbi:MAG: hypothetical protein KF746_06930 [Chitinophagaceae bacterium]|nr:hypothetical protein [Chitinophagaceae bacterium]